MLSPVFGAAKWVLYIFSQPSTSIAKTSKDFCVLGSHLLGHRAFGAKTQMVAKWLATLGRGRGMGGTGCLGETGREGGGVAGEERGSHSSPSWDPGKVRLGIPRWQGYNPHPEAATHAVSSTE